MNNNLYLWTIYNPKGERIELGVAYSTEHAKERAEGQVRAWGEGYTYKVWEAQEVKVR
jgi:hypothetical protein